MEKQNTKYLKEFNEFTDILHLCLGYQEKAIFMTITDTKSKKILSSNNIRITNIKDLSASSGSVKFSYESDTYKGITEIPVLLPELQKAGLLSIAKAGKATKIIFTYFGRTYTLVFNLLIDTKKKTVAPIESKPSKTLKEAVTVKKLLIKCIETDDFCATQAITKLNSDECDAEQRIKVLSLQDGISIHGQSLAYVFTDDINNKVQRIKINFFNLKENQFSLERVASKYLLTFKDEARNRVIKLEFDKNIIA